MLLIIIISCVKLFSCQIRLLGLLGALVCDDCPDRCALGKICRYDFTRHIRKKYYAVDCGLDY